jgi:hypothetical protein
MSLHELRVERTNSDCICVSNSSYSWPFRCKFVQVSSVERASRHDVPLAAYIAHLNVVTQRVIIIIIIIIIIIVIIIIVVIIIIIIIIIINIFACWMWKTLQALQ